MRLDGVSPQRRNDSGVPLEVWVKEVIISPGGTVGIRQVVSVHWGDHPEAVQLELPHEVREVGGLKGVHVFHRAGMGGQDLPLEKLLVDDDRLALAVPEDGPFQWVVYQPP